MLLDLLQQELGVRDDKHQSGAGDNKTVTRGFGRLLAVPVAFTVLTAAFGTTVLPSTGVAATAVYGSEVSVTSRFSGHNVPALFATLTSQWASPTVQADAVYWGDNYQPRANLGAWRATVVNDNTVLPTKAVQGSEVVLKSQFAGFNVPGAFNLQQNYGTTPIPRLAVLWGDGYTPYVQLGTWKPRVTNDNPTFAQVAVSNVVYGSETSLQSRFPAFNVAASFSVLGQGWNTAWLPADHIVWGDNFQPRAAHGSWKWAVTNDNPPVGAVVAATAVFGDAVVLRTQFKQWNAIATTDNPQLPRPAILWSDNYQPRAQHGSWKPQVYSDNPVFQFIVAVSGDTFIARSKFEPYNIAAEFNNLSRGWTTTWSPSLRILWGDGFIPFARHTSWTARDFLLIPKAGGGEQEQQAVVITDYRKLISPEMERIAVVKG